MRTPTVALSGAGGPARAWAAACRSLGWTITVVVSPTPEGARLAAELGARAVDVATATSERVADLLLLTDPGANEPDLVGSLLDRGHHVLVPPPLAHTATDADALVHAAADAAARARGATLLYGEPVCAAPVVGQLLAGLDRLRSTPTHLSSRSIAPTTADGADRSSSALLHHGLGSVAVSLLAARVCGLGAPAAVDASRGQTAEEMRDLQLRFAAGPSVTLHASWGPADAPVWDFQVATDTEVLRVDLYPTPVLERNGEPQPGRTDAPMPADPARLFGYVPLLEQWWDDIVEGRSPMFPATFGRDVLEIARAANESAAGGVPVTISTDRDPSRSRPRPRRSS